MRRKIIAILLSVCFLLCFASCEGTKTEVHIDNNIDNNIDNQFQQGDSDIDIQETPNETESTTEEKAPVKEETTQKQETPTKQPSKVDTTVSAHIHSYSSATCTQPKSCSCGATSGTALGHNYSNATCTSPQTCKRCGVTSGSALGHSYSSATCTSAKKCSRCGATSGSALGHNYVNNKCSRCGKTDPDSLPVKLEDLHVVDDSNYVFDDDMIKSTYGNSYSNAHRFNARNSYAVFNLDGKYSNFTGEIVLKDTVASNHISLVNIYVDGRKVYSVSDITKTTNKIKFNIDVRNAQTLKIEVANKSDWVHLECLCIVNTQLTK